MSESEPRQRDLLPDENEEVEVSLVLSGRNDNWMGLFDRVAPFACQHNCELLDRLTSSFELIFVEWAPLTDREPLSTRLAAIDPRVRCYIVPSAVHRRFEPQIGFLQYHARNVGIRRAHGRVVVATNGDILFDPAVIRALLALDDNTLLRAPRLDISAAVLDIDDLEERLRFAQDPDHHVALHAIDRTLPTGATIAYLTNAAGDFAAMSRTSWERCGGFHERVDASLGVDSEIVHQAEALRIGLCACAHPIYHVDHDEFQPGRMSFPPYSRVGYSNPAEWGLGNVRFESRAPQVFRCPEEARIVPITDRPPDHLPAHGRRQQLLIRFGDLELDWKLIVVCGWSDSMCAFLEQAGIPPNSVLFSAASSESSPNRDANGPVPYDLRPWPASIEPIADVRYLVEEGSEAEQRLTQKAAVEGVHYVVVDEYGLTLSFLRRAIEDRKKIGTGSAAAIKKIVLVGYGRNGRYLYDKLRPTGVDVTVFDDDPAVRKAAEEQGIVVQTELAVDGGLFIVTPFDPIVRGTLIDRLTKAGLKLDRDVLVNGHPLPIGADEPARERFWQRRQLADGTTWYLDSALAGADLGELFQWLRRNAADFRIFSGACGVRLRWNPCGCDGWDACVSLETEQSLNSASVAHYSPFAPPGLSIPEGTCTDFFAAIEGTCKRVWMGVHDPGRLGYEQALAVARSRWPSVHDAVSNQLTLSQLPPTHHGHVLWSHLIRSFGPGLLIHVGSSSSPVPEQLASIASIRGVPPTIYSLQLTSYWHGWEMHALDPEPRGVEDRAGRGIAHVCERPEVAAKALAPYRVSLVVFADLRSIWELNEGYALLSPLVPDGAHIALCGVAPGSGLCRVAENLLRFDRRFEVALWFHDILVLKRIPL